MGKNIDSLLICAKLASVIAACESNYTQRNLRQPYKF